jgi:hypothetical protein
LEGPHDACGCNWDLGNNLHIRLKRQRYTSSSPPPSQKTVVSRWLATVCMQCSTTKTATLPVEVFYTLEAYSLISGQHNRLTAKICKIYLHYMFLLINEHVRLKLNNGGKFTSGNPYLAKG